MTIAIVLLCIFSVLLSAVVVYFQHQKDYANIGIDSLFDKYGVIMVSEEPLTYITSAKNAQRVFIDYMRANGWEHLPDEQMGAGHMFEKGNERSMFISTYELMYWLWIER